MEDERKIYNLAKALNERLYMRFDTDHNWDGKITLQELKRDVKWWRLNNEEKTLVQLFKKLDHDNDAAIDAKGFQDDLANLLREFESKASVSSVEPKISVETKIATLVCREWASMEETWTKMDKNKDGKLSLVEFSKGLTQHGGKFTLDEVTKLWRRMDQNGDGKLERKEFVTTLKKLLIKELALDKIDKKFVESLSKHKEEVEKIWSASDKNGDGKITMPEFLTGLKKMGIKKFSLGSLTGLWRAIDVDGSLKLSKKEFLTTFNLLMS
ncbi:hypothetical protein AAMO2058_000763500 [Amorphochlora amoebiformis]